MTLEHSVHYSSRWSFKLIPNLERPRDSNSKRVQTTGKDVSVRAIKVAGWCQVSQKVNERLKEKLGVLETVETLLLGIHLVALISVVA